MRTSFGALAVAVIVTTGCGTEVPGSGSESGAVLGSDDWEKIVHPDCSEPGEMLVSPATYVASVAEWMRLEEIGGYDRSETPYPMSGTLVGPKLTDTGERVEVPLVFQPGISRAALDAMSAGAKVFIGYGDSRGTYRDNYVRVALVETPSKELFFAGECFKELVEDPIRQSTGDQFDSAVRDAIGVDFARAAALLGEPVLQPETEVKDPEGPIFLNPETVSQEVLDRLRAVPVQLEWPESWPDNVIICSESAEGWNDCASAALPGNRTEINWYVTDDNTWSIVAFDQELDVRLDPTILGKVTLDGKSSGGVQLAIDGSWPVREAGDAGLSVAYPSDPAQ